MTLIEIAIILIKYHFEFESINTFPLLAKHSASIPIVILSNCRETLNNFRKMGQTLNENQMLKAFHI